MKSKLLNKNAYEAICRNCRHGRLSPEGDTVLCVKKGIESELFEKILSGVNHGEIGARIAEKWNFPKQIVSVIRYHHSPEIAPPDFRKLSAVIYLADLMTHYQNEEIEFYQIDSNILNFFNIQTESQFKKISEKLKFVFSNRMN